MLRPGIILIAVILLAGCTPRKKDDEIKNKVAEDLKQGVKDWQKEQEHLKKQQEMMAQKPLSIGDAEIKLVEKGKSPLKPIRYSFAPGDYGTLQVDVGLTTKIPRDEKMVDFNLPFFRFLLSVKGEKDAEKNAYRVDFKYAGGDVFAENEVPPGLIEHMRPELKSLEGLSGSVWIDDRGLTKEARIPLPPRARLRLKQTFDLLLALLQQTVVPVPEEAIGTGAIWTVSRTIMTFEAEVQQTVTYELIGITDNSASFDVKVVRTAEPQPCAAPMRTPANLKDYAYKALGSRTVSLASPMPVITMKSESTRTMVAESAPGVPMKLDVTFRASAQKSTER